MSLLRSHTSPHFRHGVRPFDDDPKHCEDRSRQCAEFVQQGQCRSNRVSTVMGRPEERRRAEGGGGAACQCTEFVRQGQCRTSRVSIASGGKRKRGGADEEGMQHQVCATGPVQDGWGQH